MGEDHFRRRQTGGPEHGRPIDRMGREDVLANEVDRLRPESPKLIPIRTVPNPTYVVDQSIEPHIGDIFQIERNFNPPA